MSLPARVVELLEVDPRASVLSRLGPRGWYTDHLVQSPSCGCIDGRPAPTCDTGQAFYKLGVAERARERPKKT